MISVAKLKHNPQVFYVGPISSFFNTQKRSMALLPGRPIDIYTAASFHPPDTPTCLLCCVFQFATERSTAKYIKITSTTNALTAAARINGGLSK